MALYLNKLKYLYQGRLVQSLVKIVQVVLKEVKSVQKDGETDKRMERQTDERKDGLTDRRQRQAIRKIVTQVK